MKKLITVLLILFLMVIAAACAQDVEAPSPVTAPAPIPTPSPVHVSPSPPEPVPASIPTPDRVPAPPLPKSGPLPAPAASGGPPAPLFEIKMIPDESHYQAGETVEIKLSFTNNFSDIITISQYPPEIQVTPWAPPWYHERILSSLDGGNLSKELEPDETVFIEFTWDQKDNEKKQVSPGWYAVTFKDIRIITQGDGGWRCSPRAPVLIQHPQAMENIIVVDQSQTAGDITIILKHVELTANGMKVYAFYSPPSYPDPSPEAEYSIDGDSVKQAFSPTYRYLENGVLLSWGTHDYLDPVPSNAKELIFRITRLGDWEGPWEFIIPLD